MLNLPNIHVFVSVKNIAGQHVPYEFWGSGMQAALRLRVLWFCKGPILRLPLGASRSLSRKPKDPRKASFLVCAPNILGVRYLGINEPKIRQLGHKLQLGLICDRCREGDGTQKTKVVERRHFRDRQNVR